jgi:hypothetical protein
MISVRFLLSSSCLQPFKGTVARDFRPLVFFTNQPHLGHWHRWNCFRSVNDTAETVSAVSMSHPEIISAVSMTLLKPFQRCQWHRWNCFLGVIDTPETLDLILIAVCFSYEEIVSAVSLILIQRYQWHHWNSAKKFFVVEIPMIF